MLKRPSGQNSLIIKNMHESNFSTIEIICFCTKTPVCVFVLVCICVWVSTCVRTCVSKLPCRYTYYIHTRRLFDVFMERICKMLKNTESNEFLQDSKQHFSATHSAIVVYSEVLFQTGSQLTYRQRKFEISSDARQMLECRLR